MLEKVTMIYECEDGCRTEVTRSYKSENIDIWEMETIFREFLHAQGYLEATIKQIFKSDDEETQEKPSEDRLSKLEAEIAKMKQQQKDLIYELQQIFNVE